MTKQDEVRYVALGEDDADVVEALPVQQDEPQTIEERIANIQRQVTALACSVDSWQTIMKELIDEKRKERNAGLAAMIEKKRNEGKAEIPEGIELHGTSQEITFYCVVKPDGFYVGARRFGSLSAAATDVSGGTRRSGWVFWKLPDGRTVKDAYK